MWLFTFEPRIVRKSYFFVHLLFSAGRWYWVINCCKRSCESCSWLPQQTRDWNGLLNTGKLITNLSWFKSKSTSVGILVTYWSIGFEWAISSLCRRIPKRSSQNIFLEHVSIYFTYYIMPYLTARIWVRKVGLINRNILSPSSFDSFLSSKVR